MRGGVYGHGSGTVLLDDLLCQGEEEDLLHCLTGPGSHTCDHSEDAGVRCEGLCHDSSHQVQSGLMENL